MEDIRNSLQKALINQGWLYGDKGQRIGHPFVWVDGDNQPQLYSVQGIYAFFQFLSMFYEEYRIPERIKTKDYLEMVRSIESTVGQAFSYYLPFLEPKELGFDKYIHCMAKVRAQDYCGISSLCPDIKKPLKHLDIGAGFGSHATYSLKGFDSQFYAIEASPHTYSVQRMFFRFLSTQYPKYLDLVECENHGLDRNRIKQLVNHSQEFRIKHVPSWYFDCIEDSSIDLVTATWVLNEVNVSGIIWLVGHALRALKKGGYFYVRDSGKLKPQRHFIDYDKLLVELGCKEIERLKVKNRVDYFGVPRVYQKIKDHDLTFEQLFDSSVGRFAVTSHGGELMQNLSETNKVLA